MHERWNEDLSFLVLGISTQSTYNNSAVTKEQKVRKRNSKDKEAIRTRVFVSRRDKSRSKLGVSRLRSSDKTFC